MNNIPIEGHNYLVKGGELDKLIFLYAFQHRRAYLRMSDFPSGSEEALQVVSSEFALTIPVGPPMPRADLESLENLLLCSAESNAIREAFCKYFTGIGFEVGPGRRPTVVPNGCRVTYVDRFTFDQAQTGSFINMTNDGFAKISYHEGMDSLKSIPDYSQDFGIACHVIEHCPNTIRAIRTACKKLKRGGVLFLVIPNKKVTFDVNRQTTSLEHFIADDFCEAPPMLEHYMEYARYCKNDNKWIDLGLSMHKKNEDFHPHTFTHESFEELLSYCVNIGAINSFSVYNPFHEKELVEFYAIIQ
jgi:hypothetical protein